MATKARLNFVIDTLAFVSFLLLTSTGVLLHYLLPPGSGQRLSVWGLGRHDWGELHFVFAVFLLLILAIHLALHSRWILGVVRGPSGAPTQLRLGLALFALVALITLAAIPLASPIESREVSGPSSSGPQEMRASQVPEPSETLGYDSHGDRQQARTRMRRQ